MSATSDNLADSTADHEKLVLRHELNEIYLLLDFLSGRPDASLAKLGTIRLPGTPGTDGVALTPEQVIAKISEIRYPPEGAKVCRAEQAAFVMSLKDRLNLMVSPANGRSIAYTAMVVAGSSSDGTAPTKRTRSWRASIAHDAYPGLAASAAWFRWSLRIGVVMTLLFAVGAVYSTGEVAFARSILQRIEALNKQQDALAETIAQNEVPMGPFGNSKLFDISLGDAKPVFRLCERPLVIAFHLKQTTPGLPKTSDKSEVSIFESVAQQQLCDRWSDLQQKIKIAYGDLKDDQDKWSTVGGAVLAIPGNLYRAFVAIPGNLYRTLDAAVFGHAEARTNAPQGTSSSTVDQKKDEGSVSEQWTSDVLTLVGNYILPILFGLLGAAVWVIRSVHRKMSESILQPRDLTLSFVRLVLGVVMGACIGLFFSPGGSLGAAGAGGVAGAVSLTTSGLAFLAGYGVEGVFKVFDGLIDRAFVLNESKAAADAASAK